MNWNTDWSPSAFTLVVVLAVSSVAVGPAMADATRAGDGAASADVPVDGRMAETATLSEANGTATPTGTNRTSTPATTPTPPAETDDPATPRTATPTPSPTTRAGPTANGSFVVSDVETPRSLRTGDRLAVAATVTNRASGNATGRVRYSFAGATVASRTVTLGPGESTRIEFDLPFADLESAGGPVEPGTYVHGVRNESGGGSARWLRVTPNVDFTVERFDAPVEVSHGEPYVVLVTVANPGNTSITRAVTYEFAGREIARRAVTVAGGDDRQVAFEVRLSDVEAVVGLLESETTYDHSAVTGDHRQGGAVRVVRGSSANASALAVESFQATDDVRPGESYRIDLSVRNVDTAGFEGQLSYRVDGTVVATEWVDVPIGERRQVSFRVGYDDVVDATYPLSSQETEHGIFAGDDAVVTRPVTVHAPVGTETPRPTPTFATTRTSGEDSAPRSAESTAGTRTPGPDAEGRCERGFFVACGGTTMDESSLTVLGVVLSAFGIVYEMFRGGR